MCVDRAVYLSPKYPAHINQVVMGLGLDSKATEREGNTPAHFAAMEGHLECLKLLVYHKDNPLEIITSRNNEVITENYLASITFHYSLFMCRVQVLKTWQSSFRNKTVLIF